MLPLLECTLCIFPYFNSIFYILCNDICGNNYASNAKCLCIIQRNAVRLICNADILAHTNELFTELNILKSPEFVQYKTAILMCHLFHGTLPIQLQNRFTILYSTTRSTRRNYTFVMVQARTNIKAMWLSLSNNLSDCNSVNTLFQFTSKCTSIFCNYSLCSDVCNFAITLQEQYNYDC